MTRPFRQRDCPVDAGRPIHLHEVAADDRMIDALSATPLHGGPIVGGHAGDELAAWILAWRASVWCDPRGGSPFDSANGTLDQ